MKNETSKAAVVVYSYALEHTKAATSLIVRVWGSASLEETSSFSVHGWQRGGKGLSGMMT